MFSFCFNVRSITIPADCVFPLYYVTRDTYFLCLVVITPLLYSSHEKNSKGINRYDPGNRSVESRCALCHDSSRFMIVVTKS